MPRGRLLIFGGDLVYPTPHADNYDARLVGPYRVASQFYDGEREEMVAIPGNHDWYDSLVAFRRKSLVLPLFCYRIRRQESMLR